jgi:hypothetical protein
MILLLADPAGTARRSHRRGTARGAPLAMIESDAAIGCGIASMPVVAWPGGRWPLPLTVHSRASYPACGRVLRSGPRPFPLRRPNVPAGREPDLPARVPEADWSCSCAVRRRYGGAHDHHTQTERAGVDGKRPAPLREGRLADGASDDAAPHQTRTRRGGPAGRWRHRRRARRLGAAEVAGSCGGEASVVWRRLPRCRSARSGYAAPRSDARGSATMASSMTRASSPR